MADLLIVDDQPDLIQVLKERCELEGHRVTTALDPAAAMAQLSARTFDMALIDVYWGDEEKIGIELLKAIRAEARWHALPIIIMTGKPDSQLTLEALQAGANDFILKDLQGGEWLEKIGRVLRPSAATPVAEPEVWESALVGSSPLMINLTKELWRVAQQQADALILGETGSGKNLTASMIHRLGPRKQKKFYAVACPAIPADLFENELFGNEPGSYTGALGKRGKVEEADGGVLFLDEIGDLAPAHQAKLLSFLETKQFMRVGGNQLRSVDVQILTATHRNLEEKVAKGEFRQDLYYRLIGNVIRIPALREHMEDLPALVWYFIKKFNALYGRNIQRVDPEVFRRLQNDPWQGNVRELQSKVQEAVRACPDQTLQVKDFSSMVVKTTGVQPKGPMSRLDLSYREAKESIMQEFHDLYLAHHLDAHDWNISETARAIGIMREQLNAVIRRYGLRAKRPKRASKEEVSFTP